MRSIRADAECIRARGGFMNCYAPHSSKSLVSLGRHRGEDGDALLIWILPNRSDESFPVDYLLLRFCNRRSKHVSASLKLRSACKF